MKILFCNITPMNRYEGASEKDKITKGAGSWVKANLDANEKWNFLNQNGKYYGFVQNSAGQFHIERLEGVSKSEDYTDNVMVVWCAPKANGKAVIVGWYENARVYRYYQQATVTVLTGIEREYFTETSDENGYLLPLEERTFEISRASISGVGTGFGQENFWYAESKYAKEVLIPSVLEFCEKHKQSRINHTSEYYKPSEQYDEIFTQEESDAADGYEAAGNYEALLPISYKLYYSRGKVDESFWIATCLKELHQYSEAIKWYEITFQNEGKQYDTLMSLGALYQQIGDNQSACEKLEEVLEMEFPEKAQVEDAVHSMLADAYMALREKTKAIEQLDEIISKSKDTQLIEYTKSIKTAWSKQ